MHAEKKTHRHAASCKHRVASSPIYRANIVYVKGCINEPETVKITGISEARKTCTGDASCYIACVRLFGPATGGSLPVGSVSDRRLASVVLRQDRSAPARTGRPSAVEPSGIPGTRRSIPRSAPSRRTPCNRSLKPRTGRPHRMLGRRENAAPPRSSRAENRPRPGHRRTTDAARLTPHD